MLMKRITILLLLFVAFFVTNNPFAFSQKTNNDADIEQNILFKTPNGSQIDAMSLLHQGNTKTTSYRQIAQMNEEASGGGVLEKKDSIFVQYKIGAFFENSFYCIWDVAFWNNVNKRCVEYDEDNNPIKLLEYIWDGYEYIYYSKTEFTNNENNLQTSQTNSYYSAPDQMWLKNSRTIFEYNSSNNKILELRQDFISNNWENSERLLYEYNNEGQNTYYIFQVWDNGTEKWVNSQKYDYTYDSNGNQNSITLLYWNNITAAWKNNTRSIFEFNVNNLETSFIYQNWNSTTLQWVNYRKYLTEYNSANLSTFHTTLNWNILGFIWENYSLESSVYDANNSLLNQLYQTWSAGSWNNSRQYTYEYDANHYKTSQTSQQWTSGAWLNDTQHLYSNDANGNISVDLNRDWDGVSSIWKDITKSHLYWETFDPYLNVTNNKELGCIIYPNPSSSYIYIQTESEISNIKIFNPLGQLVLEINTNGLLTKINTNDLNEGVYILSVNTFKGIINKKININK